MMLLAIILGLAAGWCAWYRPAWGALAVFAVLPAYQLRFSVVGLPSTVLEVVLLAAVLGAALHWVQHRSPWPRLNKRTFWAIGVWVALGLGGVWVATDHLQALGLFRAYIVEPTLLVPACIALAQDAKARKYFTHLVSVQLILFGLVALGQRMGWVDSLAPWNAESPARMTSVFPYPNAAALFAAPLAAYVLGSWLAFRGRIARWESNLWIISVFLGVVVCALAVSRGALLGLGIAAVIAGAWSTRRWLWWGLCACVVVGLLMLPATRLQLTRIVTTKDTSADVRTVLWQGTWSMLQDRPLIGAGLGAFPTVYNSYRLPKHVELLQYPHNLFLNVWSELGIAGLLYTVGILFWLSIRLFYQIRRREQWAVGVLLGWVALFIHGLVDVPFFKNDLAILTVLLLVFALHVPPGDNKIPPA